MLPASARSLRERGKLIQVINVEFVAAVETSPSSDASLAPCPVRSVPADAAR